MSVVKFTCIRGQGSDLETNPLQITEIIKRALHETAEGLALRLFSGVCKSSQGPNPGGQSNDRCHLVPSSPLNTVLAFAEDPRASPWPW